MARRAAGRPSAARGLMNKKLTKIIWPFLAILLIGTLIAFFQFTRHKFSPQPDTSKKNNVSPTITIQGTEPEKINATQQLLVSTSLSKISEKKL